MKKLQIRDHYLVEGGASIAIPITASNLEDLKKEVDELPLDCIDIIEWRMDYFDQVLLDQKVIDALTYIHDHIEGKIVLATFRTLWEGGVRAMEKKAYFHLLQLVINSKLVDIVDIELMVDKADVLTTYVDLAHQKGVKVIISNHHFDKCVSFDEIKNRFYRMEKLDGDLLKIAMMARNKNEVLDLILASAQVNEHSEKLIVSMSMGELGKISRIACGLSGSAITFASGNQASAPGQINVIDLKKLLSII